MAETALIDASANARTIVPSIDRTMETVRRSEFTLTTGEGPIPFWQKVIVAFGIIGIALGIYARAGY